MWTGRRQGRGYGCLKHRRIYARIGQVFNEFLNVVNDAARRREITRWGMFLPSLATANLFYVTRGEFLSHRTSYEPRIHDSRPIRINCGDKGEYFSEIDISMGCYGK